LDLTKRKMTRKNETLVDDTFHVWETRFGLWSTQTIDGYQHTLGLTGLTRDAVVEMTRWHLQHLQEGDLDQYSKVIGSSVVDGKL
jgi:hypothetical protein